MAPPRAPREPPPQLRVVYGGCGGGLRASVVPSGGACPGTHRRRRRKRGRALAERFEAQLLEAVRRAGRIEEIRGDRTVLDRRGGPPPGGPPPPPRPPGLEPDLKG